MQNFRVLAQKLWIWEGEKKEKKGEKREKKKKEKKLVVSLVKN